MGQSGPPKNILNPHFRGQQMLMPVCLYKLITVSCICHHPAAYWDVLDNLLFCLKTRNP